MGPHPAVAQVRSVVRTDVGDLGAGELVLVACSGGADSLALAAAAAFVGERAGLRVGAVTVDHALQDGSDRRAREVAARLSALGCEPVEVAAVAVGRVGGPEAAARTARYAALGEAAERLGAAAVLLGHTADDQAETVLLGLTRGSGPRALAGMPARTGVYRRPLLGLTRDLVREACLAEGLTPWEDPHNADPAYTRSRIRHEALPALERVLGPGVAANLTRTARLLRADAEALDDLAAAAAADCARDGGLDCAALAALPVAVRPRGLRSATLAAGAPAGTLALTHVEAVERLVLDWRGQGPLDLPGGVTALRRCAILHLQGPARPRPHQE
ncbi:MAG: tRNA lysidine(34) synthetase TilS [Sporichthyaceae bacterium]